jgi:hypothetical protein
VERRYGRTITSGNHAMTYRLLIISAAALALAACHRGDAPAPANDSANITAIDGNALPPDANITDVPADDGDAPAIETNAQ